MGRYFYNKKSTVDDYKSISVKKLNEWNYFSQGITSGTIRWSRHGEQIGSIGVFMSVSGDTGTMRLNYIYDKKDDMNYEVRLDTTACHFGGVRWWFICPLTKNGIYCGRRVGVLYLGKYAGCRHCYELTYQSCQDSHKFDALARSMGLFNERELKRAMLW